MKWILSTALAFLAFGIQIPAENSSHVIRIRVTNFPPNYYQEGDKWTGLDVELAEALIARAGFVVEHMELPWSRALLYLAEGKLDLMMNLSKTADREEQMRFIGPERRAVVSFITRKEMINHPFLSLSELVNLAKERNTLIGIQKDAKYSPEFDTRYANEPEFAALFDVVTSANLNINKTIHRRILGFFEARHWAAYQMRTNPEFKDLAVHSFIVNEEDVYFGITKEMDEDIFQRLREAHNTLEKDGTYQTIRDRWEMME